jgi:hypothetical protein
VSGVACIPRNRAPSGSPTTVIPAWQLAMNHPQHACYLIAEHADWPRRTFHPKAREPQPKEARDNCNAGSFSLSVSPPCCLPLPRQLSSRSTLFLPAPKQRNVRLSRDDLSRFSISLLPTSAGFVSIFEFCRLRHLPLQAGQFLLGVSVYILQSRPLAILGKLCRPVLFSFYFSLLSCRFFSLFVLPATQSTIAAKG